MQRQEWIHCVLDLTCQRNSRNGAGMLSGLLSPEVVLVSCRLSRERECDKVQKEGSVVVLIGWGSGQTPVLGSQGGWHWRCAFQVN